jgi:hypothetical protein
MSAPGSQPVDPLPPAKDQGDPELDYSGPQIPPGTSGKPKASTTYSPPPPAWGKTTTPDVIRKQ